MKKIIETFKMLFSPHDRMVRDLEAKRQKPKDLVSVLADKNIITTPSSEKVANKGNPRSRMEKDLEEQQNKVADEIYRPISLDAEEIQSPKNDVPQENPDVVSPSDFLGEDYGTPLHWAHKDDMFVNFQILDSVVMEDVDFFLRYTGEDADGMCAPRPLSAEEKLKYPLHIFPCFTEVAEVISAQMTKPLQYLNADQECFVVAYQNVFGLLVFGNVDTVDISRRSVGFEDEKEKLHYQIQFMRFDKAAIERMGLVQDPATYHSQMHFKGFPTLRVNFAKYNNE